MKIKCRGCNHEINYIQKDTEYVACPECQLIQEVISVELYFDAWACLIGNVNPGSWPKNNWFNFTSDGKEKDLNVFIDPEGSYRVYIYNVENDEIEADKWLVLL